MGTISSLITNLDCIKDICACFCPFLEVVKPRHVSLIICFLLTCNCSVSSQVAQSWNIIKLLFSATPSTPVSGSKGISTLPSKQDTYKDTDADRGKRHKGWVSAPVGMYKVTCYRYIIKMHIYLGGISKWMHDAIQNQRERHHK